MCVWHFLKLRLTVDCNLPSFEHGDHCAAYVTCRPVRVVPDPIRGAPHVLVMCEVFSPDGTPHPTNTRAQLREIMSDKVKESQPWFGFEQEYTMLNKKTGRVYGWPDNGYPAPQGPFYCKWTYNVAFDVPGSMPNELS